MHIGMSEDGSTALFDGLYGILRRDTLWNRFVCSIDDRVVGAMDKIVPGIWGGKELSRPVHAVLRDLNTVISQTEPGNGKWFPLAEDEVDVHHVATGLIEVLRRHQRVMEEAA